MYLKVSKLPHCQAVVHVAGWALMMSLTCPHAHLKLSSMSCNVSRMFEDMADDTTVHNFGSTMYIV